MDSLTISDYLMLRRTVDVLYDVQDVRMRTANRLRLMPKETSMLYVAPLLTTEDKLTKEIEGFLSRIPIYTLWLQQVKGVGPRLAGSIIAQTMIRFEKVSASEYKKMKSQLLDETQSRIASHNYDENQIILASQSTNETQNEIASQVTSETPRTRASHNEHETQTALASQDSSETHSDTASHESIETQNDDASLITNETHDELASQATGETQTFPASQKLLETQKVDASHAKGENQERYASHDIGENQDVTASRISNENQIPIASQNPNDTQSRIAFSQEQLELAQKTERGDYLIPVLRGIGAFDTVSKYWAWWGLHVKDGKAPKRSRGDRINWNSALRTLAWKIGKQFVLQGEHYRKVYDEYKERVSATRLPVGICTQYQECLAKMKKRKKPACKGHVDAMARRYAVKMFLSHLWEKWRELEGLPVRAPYVIDKLGHTTKSLRR